jgi:hypothetical protein
MITKDFDRTHNEQLEKIIESNNPSNEETIRKIAREEIEKLLNKDFVPPLPLYRPNF